MPERDWMLDESCEAGEENAKLDSLLWWRDDNEKWLDVNRFRAKMLPVATQEYNTQLIQLDAEITEILMRGATRYQNDIKLTE